MLIPIVRGKCKEINIIFFLGLGKFNHIVKSDKLANTLQLESQKMICFSRKEIQALIP